jgi:hypothetical protein
VSTPYQFGVKVSIATILKEGLMVDMRKMPDNRPEREKKAEHDETANQFIKPANTKWLVLQTLSTKISPCLLQAEELKVSNHEGRQQQDYPSSTE